MIPIISFLLLTPGLICPSSSSFESEHSLFSSPEAASRPWASRLGRDRPLPLASGSCLKGEEGGGGGGRGLAGLCFREHAAFSGLFLTCPQVEAAPGGSSGAQERAWPPLCLGLPDFKNVLNVGIFSLPALMAAPFSLCSAKGELSLCPVPPGRGRPPFRIHLPSFPMTSALSGAQEKF